MSKKGLKILARKNILLEVTSMHLETCVDCLASKLHEVAFQHLPPKRKSRPLHLVHMNLSCMKKELLVVHCTWLHSWMMSKGNCGTLH